MAFTSRLYSSIIPIIQPSSVISSVLTDSHLALTAFIGVATGAAVYHALNSPGQTLHHLENEHVSASASASTLTSSTSTSEDNDSYRAMLLAERENLPIITSLRANPRYTEEEAYNWMKGTLLDHSLTATTLSGRGKFAIRPVQFFDAGRTECITIIHLGRSLCGHDGIVHGGLLGTIMDEMLASVALPSLPNRIGFTANLNINYRAPVISDQFVVATSQIQRTEGRKAFAEATIISVDGSTTFVEATALFISPKSDNSIGSQFFPPPKE